MSRPGDEVSTELDGERGSTTSEPEGDVYLVLRDGGRVDVRTLAEGESVIVGREAGVDLLVESARVSRKHARIVHRGGQVLVEDLSSRNGTRIGHRFLNGQQAVAHAGDLIGVGPAEIAVARYAKRQDPPAAAPLAGEGARDDRTALGAEDDALVIADPCMVQLHAVVRRMAATPSNVLILGETGVGKEIVAERLHTLSPRCDKPFVRLNCAAIPEALLESELFGVERGAYTGADRRRVGYFEAAEGGTLFLDEIGELPPAIQAKLLRVLEQRTIVRLGSTDEHRVDVRLVAATHRDLLHDVEADRFRRDLYFRISTLTLEVPPLRERPTEISLLASLFARSYARTVGFPDPCFTEAAIRALVAHGWPGNVRELRNAVEHSLVMAEGGAVAPEHLPRNIRAAASMPPPSDGDHGRDSTGDVKEGMRSELEAIERQRIVAALEAEGGNQTRAAKRLGISRRALLYKLQKYKQK
jgi:transcriptional regulator with PAS, ATPase and Fis domain